MSVPKTLLVLSLMTLLVIGSFVPVTAEVKTIATSSATNAASAVAVRAQDELTRGLREALSVSTARAVKELGRDGGFLNNLNVRIPMPKPLRPVEKTLRLLGRGKVADDFITAMNRAAEKAVPEALDVFADSIRQMTFRDAYNIVRGSDDAATQFFRRTSEARLREKFMPIVQRFTDEAGVTAQYKRLLGQAGGLARLGGNPRDFDLDEYVTQKALDGLFYMMAQEETKIRRNPVARTTDLLRVVFGRNDRNSNSRRN